MTSLPSGATPGPWLCEIFDRDDPCSRGNFHVIRQDCHDTGNFSHYVASTWGGLNEADASLIAAAPDLYASLRALIERFGPEELKAARAALAKADGGQA